MRTLGFAALVLLSVPLFGACGGADSSDLLGGGGNPNPNPTVDSGNTVDGSSGQDSGANCDPSKCGISVPQGFRLVTYGTDVTKTCASGWRSTDVVSNPTADPAACSCACNVTTAPSCAGGTIHRYLDQGTSATCTSPATTLIATGGCDTIGGTLYLQYAHYEADPPPASGGACSFDATLDKSKVTGAPGRLCEPPASCAGAVCGAANVCVAQDGDVACPKDYPSKTLTGTPSAECASCGSSCSVSADCTGTLSLYTDYMCMTGKQDLPVDGTCNASPSSSSGYLTFKYAGSVKGSPSCGTPPPNPMATPKLDMPTTVCCQKPG